MVFRDIPTPTYSDLWYRIRDTSPRVSPHAHVTRQSRGMETVYIVEESASGTYYRISEPAYLFLGMLDGKTTAGGAWEACVSQLQDNAPSQRECCELLAQLQQSGLLIGDLPLSPELVLERRAGAKRRRWEQRTGRWMSFSIPLVNPERWLERHKGVCRLVFSRAGFVLWCLVVGVGAYFVLANLDGLASGLNNLLDPGNLVLLLLLFVVLRGVHELGHAAACKAFGGRVSEIGVLMIAYMLPLPYCEASSSWKFPSTFRRVAVAAAGVYVELFCAGIAAVVWANTPAGTAHTLAYNTMILSGATSIFFNMNPLIRYDGYYILSDLLGSPNLAQRARQLWIFCINRFGFGSRRVRPPRVRDVGETVVLGVYHLLAVPYRFLIMFAILFYVSTRYPTIGLLIGVVIFSVWIVWPVLKGVGYLFSDPALTGHRLRALGVTAGLLGGVFALVGLVPVSDGVYAVATIEPARRAPVRAGESGFIASLEAEPGQRVREGDVLLRLRNPDTRAECAVTEARLEAARARLASAEAASPGEAVVAKLAYETALRDHERSLERVERLVIRAPIDGRFLPPPGQTSLTDLRNLVGARLEQGALFAVVADTETLVVRALVPDADAAHLFSRVDQSALREVEAGVRVHGRAGEVVPARITRVVARGDRSVHNPSLTTAGGGTLLSDPGARDAQTTLHPQFPVELRPVGPVSGWRPGVRARVRIPLPPESILSQVERRLRQYISTKFG